MDNIPVRRDRSYPLSYFLAFEEPYFLRQAFKVLMGRDPDPPSAQFFETELRLRKLTPVEVIGHLRSSPEGIEQGIRVRGLRWRHLVARMLRWIPALGPAVAQRIWGDSSIQRPLPEVEKATMPPRISAPDLSALGYPKLDHVPPTGEAPRPLRPIALALPDAAAEAVFATVCSRSHLPYSRTLVESIQEHHPGAAVVVCIADDDGSDPKLPTGAVHVAGSQLGVPNFDFVTLKYTASELCCALKPFLVDAVLAGQGCRGVVYLDSDMCVFSPLSEMMERMKGASVVVTPHTSSPFPHPERFGEKPSLGDLLHAGVMNAGTFGMRDTEDTRGFLETWKRMVVEPGAFWIPGQTEQQSFNWVTSLVEDLEVLREPAYNVAYWNLHDRSLRWEDGSQPKWTVNGTPLVSFHFSGYSPAVPSLLSHWDTRHLAFVLQESVVRLLQEYRARVIANGLIVDARSSYGYEKFPSGIAIDRRMRSIFKEFEPVINTDPSPWSEGGEAHYGRVLMSPQPGASSLLPVLFAKVYEERQDLHGLFPRAHTEPDEFLRWVTSNGIYEFGYDQVFERYRRCIPDPKLVSELTALRQEHPRIFRDLGAPLGDDRQTLLERLDRDPHRSLAERISSGEGEIHAGTKIGALRSFVDRHASLRAEFPDLLGRDAKPFSEWLREVGIPHHGLPEGIDRLFTSCADGQSLARIFSHVNAQYELTRWFPRAFVGDGNDDLVRVLAGDLRHGRQFGLEDLAMFLWITKVRPWTGVGPTLELLSNQRNEPSSLTPEGQERLLQGYLERPEFVAELERFRRKLARRHAGELITNGAGELWSRQPVSLNAVVDSAADNGHRATKAPLRRQQSRSGQDAWNNGVNLFGYFHSPIGLGMMTRGLAQALRGAGMAVQPNPLGNVSMIRDLDPDDFVACFDFRHDTNIFVSYPHFPEHLLTRLPWQKVLDRRNVVYLAWEQEDVSPFWGDAYRDFDDVWALSDFAASNLSRGLERTVQGVPCVLDLSTFPPPRSKSDYGLDPAKWTILYVFHASSSIERKNPEAAVEALELAFSARDDVCLVFKISGTDNVEHSRRYRRFVERVESSKMDIRLFTEPLDREGILGLISAGDCYLSLHRAEGFGYPCAEAMAYGKPVVASKYSGNLHFMNDENSYLVPCRTVDVTRAEGPFLRGSVWAEPSVEAAAKLLVQAREQTREREERSQAARRAVESILSVDAVAARIKSLLR